MAYKKKEKEKEIPEGPERLTASDWMKRIKRGLRYRDEVKKEQQWDRLQKEYKGKYEIKLNGVSAAPINLVFGYVDTTKSRIYFRDPHISVNPRGAESIGASRILELDVNYSFRQLKVKQSVDRLLNDALIIGHGWFKFGYLSEIGEMVSDPGTEPNYYIKDEQIFISYVPWSDIVFDNSMSKDPPNDCRWIAHRIVKPIDEIKRDKNYTNTRGLDSNVALRDTKDQEDKAKSEMIRDNDVELFEFWEVTDIDTKKIYAICDQSNKYLREVPYNYEMKGLNYSSLKFNIVNDEPYPISDVYIIEPQMLERIKLRASQLNHIKRWSRQLSIEEGSMTPIEIEKFTKGVDGGVVQRKKGYAPPVPIEYAAMQAEIFALDSLIQSDMDAVIGQSDLDRGAPPKTNAKTTKFQLQEQNQGTSTRQNRKQDRLEDFFEEVAEKYIALVKQFQDIPKYVRITGMNESDIKKQFGSMKGVTADSTGIRFTREAIRGEYDIDCKAGSTLPLNRENKIRLYETVLEKGPNMGIVPGSPIANVVRKSLLRELDITELEVACEQQEQMEKQMAMMPKPPQAPQGGGQTHHVVHHQGPPAKPHPGQPGPMPAPNAQAM